MSDWADEIAKRIAYDGHAERVAALLRRYAQPVAPAASSLPPSDRGGADWATKAGHDIADSVGKGLAASTPLEAWAIKQLGATYAVIIRKHAPTQQPAEQPEAEVGSGFVINALRCSLVECVAYLDRMGQDGVRERAYKALSLEAATPRPESPDAQRGELRDNMVRWCENMVNLNEQLANAADDAFSKLKFRNYASVYNSTLTAAKRFAALPAKGSGARSDTERLDWLEAHGHVAAKYQHLPPASDHTGPTFWKINWTQGNEDTLTLRAAIDAAMASPPASHSKQRERS